MINERFARSTENLFNFRFRSRAEVFRRRLRLTRRFRQ